MAEDTPAPAASAEARRMIDDFEMAVQARFKGAGDVGWAFAEAHLSAYVAGLEADVALRRSPPTPRIVAAAWRAFRGDRKGQSLGPGPAFVEAITAALAAQDKPDAR